jgi:hypothetical protein
MNVTQSCKRCGAQTPHMWARYCDRCEAWFSRQDDQDGRDDMRRDPVGNERQKESA